MSCYLCQEKSEFFCKTCSQRVCKYDSSLRVHNYEKQVFCNFCNFNMLKSDNFLELQAIYKACVEKLEKLEMNSANSGLELNNLLDLEILLSKQLESAESGYTEAVESLKNKVMLEETSKNNALQSAASIYRAIENQGAQIDMMKSKLRDIEQETMFLSMLNSHVSRENAQISHVVKESHKDLSQSADLKSVQKVICQECQVKVFGSVSNVSVLLLDREQNKACSGCVLV